MSERRRRVWRSAHSLDELKQRFDFHKTLADIFSRKRGDYHVRNAPLHRARERQLAKMLRGES